MMGGWVSGLSVALWWFGIGCYPLFLFLVPVPLFVYLFFQGFYFWKSCNLFFAKKTHFFPTSSLEKNLKISKDSHKKTNPRVHSLPSLEFPCVDNAHTIYDFSCSKLFAKCNGCFFFFHFINLSKATNLWFKFFKVFPKRKLTNDKKLQQKNSPT